MEASGKNRTPDKLQKEERDKLFKICDPYLQLMVEQLEPEFVVGVGRFAKDRAAVALEGYDVKIAQILTLLPQVPGPIRIGGDGTKADEGSRDLA